VAVCHWAGGSDEHCHCLCDGNLCPHLKSLFIVKTFWNLMLNSSKLWASPVLRFSFMPDTTLCSCSQSSWVIWGWVSKLPVGSVHVTSSQQPKVVLPGST
jgi:hypothetical protein